MASFNWLQPKYPGIPKLTHIRPWCLAWGNDVETTRPVIWQENPVTLCSQGTSQPLSAYWAESSSRRFVVLGEVWLSNRMTLLRQLDIPLPKGAGDDRQLIAQLWEQFGPACLSNLLGMFGFAIWDREQQELWLVRDACGAYTLYYTIAGATTWIAPQLRSLAPYHSMDLDWVALRDYLCCAFVPGDRTLWQQVRELRPGSLLRLPDRQLQTYWQPQEKMPPNPAPFEYYRDQLRDELNQVMREYLPTGEPVGIFLSGGLDSSCITALAHQLHDAPIHTYSIHFGPQTPNELEFSNLIAKQCQTEHHILEISLTDLWGTLPDAMAALDDPIGDPLTVPNLLLGKLAKQAVQVILNGEGGDPCFGGPKNQPMLMNTLYHELTQQDALSAYLLAFQKCAADLPQLLKSEIWAGVKEIPSIFSEDLQSDARYLNQLMSLNIKFKGADHILTKVNNLTQATGLQGRSPLFDRRIVDMSLQIPPGYKLRGAEEKAILKQAVADLLPEQILRRPKSGMMVPVQLGFRQVWRRQAKALLLNRKAAIAPYLNQTLLRDWLEYEGDTWGRYGVKLWLLASLEIWLQGNRT
ncbi:MAG: asparagine synthase-related protein [Leptolyngbyaceae cyanobacterium bins.59]|nr:asparagine synthase-related protein [Leptolyngbyaceae cyanobacterium bins.59]